MHTCPVCFYDRLRHPPDEGVICPSCGTQFGYSDAGVSHAELLRLWLLEGHKWHSNVTPPPPNWDAYKQLKKHGVDYTKVRDDETAPRRVVSVASSYIVPAYAIVRTRVFDLAHGVYNWSSAEPTSAEVL